MSTLKLANLTPDEQAEFDSKSAAPDNGVPAGAKPFDPVASLDAAGLAELADNKLFDPVQWATENYSSALDPKNLQKLADANAIIRQRGFQLKDLPSPKEAVGGVLGAVKGAAKVARNVASIATAPLVSAIGDITGQGPEFGAAVGDIAAKQAGETVAGIEQAGHGLVELGAKAGSKLIRKTIGTNYGEMTPEQRKNAFLSDLGNAQVAQQVAVGQGPFTQAVAGQFISELKQRGVNLDPKEIADLSAGDPISFIAFGGGFKILGKGGQVLGTAVNLNAAQKAVTALAQQAAGKAVQAVGGATKTAGSVAEVAAPALPAAGAVIGTVKAGPVGALGGLKTGELAAKAAEKFGEQAADVGGKISQFGEQVAGESAITSPYAQAIRDAIKVAPPAVAELAKGAGLDIGLAAASSETPQETQATSAFGTLFGALGAAGHIVKTGVQGQLLTARPWGSAAESKPYGTTAFLDAEHARAQQTLPSDVTQRANSIREFLRSVPGDVQAYLMPDKAATEQFLIDDYAKRNGAAPTGQALANIKSDAEQRGMIRYSALADDGSTKRIVLLNDVESAPHEAFHGIQDVLGNSGNEAIDRLIFDQYHDRWENIGESYATRLSGGDLQGKSWRDVVTERTGTDNPDRYMAREIAAENFDTVFKNLGGSMTEGNSLPQKLARVIAKTMNLFGAEPFSGAQTAGLKLEPNFGVSEEVKKLVSGITEQQPTPAPATPAPLVTPKAAPGKPTITPAAPKVATPPTSSVVGVSPDAKAAQAWAASKSDPRLVSIVNSIVANQLRAAPGEAAPVRLKYLSVAGEEGSTRTPRRSEQEEAYLKEALGAMPAETRAEVEKTHAHVRFDPVKKGNEMQSIGYSLEKIVENAQRAAKWLASNDAARPISPYEVDPATGSFTQDAWKQLISDIQTYTVNQQAGGTGAGKALVQPANAAELKISVPPVQAAKFVPLEQSKADFINTLMGFKLPETTRVSRAGGTPGNIVGQEISKANELPFIQPRISEPAVQRAGGKEFPGFTGRSIKEVNPLRRQLEAAGFPVNELTEVVERVNLKHLESVTPAPEVQFRPGVTDTIRAGFLPAEAEAKRVDELDADGFSKWAKEQPGGLTGTAHRVGRESPSQEFTDSLNANAQKYRDQAKQVLDSGDFAKAMPVVMKGQFFREAWEAATGTGSAGEFLKQRDSNYKAPFPPVEANSPIGQFLPTGEKVEKAAIILHDGKMFTGPFHGAAFRAAQEAGAIPEGESVSSLMPVYIKDEGFVTDKGTYLSRKEAAELAIANQQAKPGTANHMLASRGRLEAHTFQEERAFLPNEAVKEVADDYAKSAGLKPAKFEMRPVNEPLAKKLADFYDEAKHSPDDPAVQKSYKALADETLAQYEAMKNAGFSVEPYEGKGEPYKNSAEMMTDVKDNKHLFFLRTEGNFSGENNPMLAPSGVKINGKELAVNDVFRAVHDFFGHATEGLQFGPKGEFNAWRVHSEMYSPEAQGALAAETLAQNSFVNFGKHLRNEAGNIPAKGEPGYVPLPERKFAEQKNVVVPPEMVAEAKSQFSPKGEEEKSLTGGAQFARFFDKTENTPNGGANLKNFKDVLNLPTKGFEKELAAYQRFGSNFQKHIATSIPGFVDARIRLLKALVGASEEYGKNGEPVKMLDITASEGYWPKAWGSLAQEQGVDAHATALDALPAFEKSFKEKEQVPNVEFKLAAWGEGFKDPTSGKDIPTFKPQDNSYDIIHEGMGFQFFTPDRKQNVEEVKRLLKPDGVFVTLEKFKNPDYAEREKLKDEFKGQFYSKEQMTAKQKEVLKSDTNSVGMDAYQYDRRAYEKVLTDNFDHVTQVFSSGNFAGYLASDSKPVIDKMVSEMGSTDTKFSVEKTPREITQFSPKGEEDPYAKYNVDYEKAVAKRKAAGGKSGLTGWILPNNTLVPLSQAYHEQYLADNSADLNKKFGTNFNDTADVEARQQALDKGFIRMREQPAGTLHVEAGQTGWTKAARDKVFETVANNLDNIDQIQVSLLDKNGIVKRQGHERLMDYDTDSEKLDHLPLISEGGRGAFLPKESILIGTVDEDADVKSKRIPYSEAAGPQHAIAGMKSPWAWRLVGDELFWWGSPDEAQRESVKAHVNKKGSKVTKEIFMDEIKNVPQYYAAYNRMHGENLSAFLPSENENLPGMDVGREFNRAAINQMNKAELRQHFPEAIIPRANDELINSNIVGSPLAKQEGGREAGIEAFANTLADFYNEIKDQPEAKAGASWYSDFTPRLKKEFGKDAPIMAELLAATSPQTNPQVNFGYAFDALEGFKRGRYDRQIAKFKEGLDRLEDGSLAKIYDRDVKAGKVNNPPDNPSDSTYLAHWIDKHDLVPLGSSGKRFGTHSIRVLQVLSRKWLEMNAGPKTSNFVQNLLGTGHEATIDLWADRTMRRIGYSGYSDRWRILPENSTGVSDEDFAFSQEAFRAAARKLGIKPSALQGALWFGEKRLWADKGWGRLDLGDYRDELKKVPMLRAGVTQREEATRLGKKAGSAEQEALDLGLTIEPRQSKFKQ